MLSDRNKYLLIFGLSFVGILWIGFSLHYMDAGLSVCYIKNIWGIPCPSCGSTRAILALAGGDIQASLSINPLGIFMLLSLLILPVWGLVDQIKGSTSMISFLTKVEQNIRKYKYAFPIILLFIGNWIWNIMKGL